MWVRTQSQYSCQLCARFNLVLPNGKKYIYCIYLLLVSHSLSLSLSVTFLAVTACCHQINIRLMPILLSFYYGHLFVRLRSRSRLSLPLNFFCILLAAPAAPLAGPSKSARPHREFNCLSKLAAQLINWLDLIGSTELGAPSIKCPLIDFHMSNSAFSSTASPRALRCLSCTLKVHKAVTLIETL